MSISIQNEAEAPSQRKSARVAARLATVVRRPTQAQLVIGATVLLFLLPALIDVFSDPVRPYGYLAADAFYYFTVAVNWVDFGIPSFDQLHPSNGFHPLWQWVVTLLYAVLKGLGFSRLALVPVAVVACLLMVSTTIVLLGLARTRQERISPLFVLLPMGAWPLLISPVWWDSRAEVSQYRITPLFGTLWNFSNGLESALLLLTFALVAWLYVKRPATNVPRALAFGLALGALSLARLDHGVFALTLAGVPLIYHLARRERQAAQLQLWTVLAWLLLLGAYLVYNRMVVGRFLPTSGAVKSTFPNPTAQNLEWLLSLGTLKTRHLMFGLGRIGSIAIPALISLLYFPFALRLRGPLSRPGLSLREGHGRFSQLMLLTALGMLGLATYNVLFVVSWQIGEWYAPISVLFVSLFAVQAAEHLARRWTFSGRRWLGVAMAFTLCAIQLLSFSKLSRLKPWGMTYASFCLVQSAKVIAHYAGAPPQLVSRDDGVVGFGTGFSTTSGTRLALDPEAVDASKDGQFEALLQKRGIDRLTSVHYLDARGFRPGERSRRVQDFAEAVLQAPPSRTYEVEYVDGRFAILRARQE